MPSSLGPACLGLSFSSLSSLFAPPFLQIGTYAGCLLICGHPHTERDSSLSKRIFAKSGAFKMLCRICHVQLTKWFRYFLFFIFLKEQSVYALAQLCDYSVISADNLRQSSCEMNKRYPGMIIEWSVLNVPHSQKFSAHSFDVFMFFIIFFLMASWPVGASLWVLVNITFFPGPLFVYFILFFLFSVHLTLVQLLPEENIVVVEHLMRSQGSSGSLVFPSLSNHHGLKL